MPQLLQSSKLHVFASQESHDDKSSQCVIAGVVQIGWLIENPVEEPSVLMAYLSEILRPSSLA